MDVNEPGSAYPLKWSEFVGQETAKRQIHLAAKSARIRKQPCEHILLTGSAGMGKTALALRAAREMRVHTLMVAGKIPMSEARRTWTSLPPRSVIVWDEFHQAVDGGKRNAEWLLHALQDGCLMGPFGPEDLPPFTLIAATNEVDVIPETIRSRMMRPRMEPYTVIEATKIVVVMAKKILTPEGLPLPSKDNARDIAAAANCNPRAMRRLLLTLRDVAVTNKAVWIGSRYHLDDLFLFAGITSDGLDQVAQEYLSVLLTEFPDGAGLATLKDRLAERDLSTTERVLVEKGYIGKTRSGRTLTAAGITRAKALTRRAA
jgi:Holliday junction DNA helicase RuvB